MVEELSPALSAFWANMFLIFILVTQRPISAWFRGKPGVTDEFKRGFGDLQSGLETGARNMIGVGIATATAGIIVGTVTLTGIGLVLTELVEVISGGNLMVDAADGRGGLADPRHGHADHGQLHHRVDADGAGGRRTRVAVRV